MDASILIAILVAVVILVVFGRLATRRGRELREQAKKDFGSGEVAEPDDHLADVSGLRPAVAEFHVHDTDAIVTFDVPLPDGEVDEVLVDLLINEAVEVTREKSHNLPITQVTRVVAKAAGGRSVGSRELDEAGVLPAPMGGHLLQLNKLGLDPVDSHFEAEKSDAGFVAPTRHSDELPNIIEELRIPKAIEVGLRSQGVDPDAMNAGDLVRAILSLFGYSISDGDTADTYFGARAGQRTYVREDIYESGGHPELDEKVIDEFMFGFRSSGADRGLLVSEKYAPFEIYERERREPRVRFVSRERLQKFIDGAALG